MRAAAPMARSVRRLSVAEMAVRRACNASPTDEYAICAEDCQEGAHEGETEGTWDQNGVFQPVKWSCEKLGDRSEKGCSAFDAESACPSAYCMWKQDSCLASCDTISDPGACWDTKHCMYTEGKCMDACWDFGSEETCLPTKTCYWHGDRQACQMGWWLFQMPEVCDQDLGYMWNGTCNLDPCSAPGEDCKSTKCCSQARGASGMTCFAKNDDYATCKETCDDTGDWSCTALGERTGYSAGCAWSGKSCASEKLCCNIGFSCAVKDEYFTGCVQTQKKTTWVTQEVPIPGGWDGRIVGPGRSEYEMQPAGPDDEKLGNSLYCFMAYLPGSYEEELVNQAKEIGASVYGGCDEVDLFHTWQSASAGWDTGESTLSNTDVFINVWEQVAKKGSYMAHDWTVKADPDCVVVPDRLKSHLDALNAPAWAAVYVKNNGMDAGLGNNGFLGAIEVFSKKAVQLYIDNADGCREALGLNAGEDGYFKGCMDSLGVGFMRDNEMFFPDEAAGACSQGQRAAFHPLKDPGEWKQCWDIVTGSTAW
jgi:hypothetical protein